MHAAFILPTRVSIPAQSRATWGTGASSTLSDTPNLQLNDSGISGLIDTAFNFKVLAHYCYSGLSTGLAKTL
jgi:hypothetical protein